MELGSERARPAPAPPRPWTTSTWGHTADPGYDWGAQEQTVSTSKYGCKKCSFFWKTIKMFLFWFGKYLSFSIHHQFASTWILQSKINTKLALQYEAVHHWTMLGITILCVRTLQLPRTRAWGTWSRRRSVRINYYFISNYHFFSSQKIVVIQQNI